MSMDEVMSVLQNQEDKGNTLATQEPTIDDEVSADQLTEGPPQTPAVPLDQGATLTQGTSAEDDLTHESDSLNLADVSDDDLSDILNDEEIQELTAMQDSDNPVLD
eukprot:GHVU01021176.1.p1 GENE.GHVU01021176.1~~GHVU01021176.1.p1  ORF type:complete len:106 (+),score=24.55 GHVU01021176.1:300-617(+)